MVAATADMHMDASIYTTIRGYTYADWDAHHNDGFFLTE